MTTVLLNFPQEILEKIGLTNFMMVGFATPVAFLPYNLMLTRLLELVGSMQVLYMGPTADNPKPVLVYDPVSYAGNVQNAVEVTGRRFYALEERDGKGA